ncbi:MAG TPA: bifunctional 2-polyprenyl-6-hydroxyphenol methylase/3-demethylubiquinol 3-O-methyltransferase UbiG [Desulfatirhabdiaceae bacterium]|nr:bifunctional 2-polyprenyl-6-hydroxyphenol methylase/3-demethylubiquinol 3-O-methyltransferase UbiG [Desulfatirhabdiaceae bacterium]
MKRSPNIDAAEIFRFNTQADRWWDRNGDCKALHDINPLRVDYIQQRSPLFEKQVLDVGCGGGILSEALARLGARVTGIDMGEGPIAVARAHAEISGLCIEYIQMAPEEMADIRLAGFDVVICMELLEHVPDPWSVIHACQILAKPGGDIFFSTINRNPKSFFFAIIGAEMILRLLPMGSHAYSRLIKPKELIVWARQSGLNSINQTGLHYNPFTRRYILGGNLDVNYMMHCRKD